MVEEIIDRLLRARGLSDADFEAFLNPSLTQLAPAEELPGVVEAAEVILAAVRERKKIVVFGDYDCDGVSATAILTKTLTAFEQEKEQIASFIPERLTEGYGMSDASLARLMREYPDTQLVVTVDNGINSVSQIASLKTRGISVVVTDHHLPGEELPAADAIVNPRVKSSSRLADLCGAGVAFLLANRLVSEARRTGLYSGPQIGGPLLVLAGLATVTDIMPLLGQNRLLVAEALKHFHTWAPLGLKELHLKAARRAADVLTSKDFSFMLGPRINAAGRLKSGMEALELVLADDREIARELARIVDLHNTERKAIEQRMTDEALSQIVEGASAQLIVLPEGHPGVAGIVAARILEKLNSEVPVCVLAGGHGSARSPAHINIRDAFVACSEYLTTYGGHAAAGGFGVKEGLIDEFRQALCAYCEKFRKSESVDAPEHELTPEIWLEPSDISLELAQELLRFEPFGEANREPEFGLRGVRLLDVKPMGSDGKNLSLSIATSRPGPSGRFRCVWWGRGDLVEELRTSVVNAYDISFTLVVSDYGELHPELHLTGIVPAKKG